MAFCIRIDHSFAVEFYYHSHSTALGTQPLRGVQSLAGRCNRRTRCQRRFGTIRHKDASPVVAAVFVDPRGIDQHGDSSLLGGPDQRTQQCRSAAPFAIVGDQQGLEALKLCDH